MWLFDNLFLDANTPVTINDGVDHSKDVVQNIIDPTFVDPNLEICLLEVQVMMDLQDEKKMTRKKMILSWTFSEILIKKKRKQ